MNVLHVVGARPNFMKAAPVIRALSAHDAVSQVLVHTGQHYDANMSDVFFQELGLPAPDENLGVGSGSHAAQTAEIMVRFEGALDRRRPDLVLVYGDVNSTVAAALVCAKKRVPVAHVEAGLRAFDRTMPEEINRVLTDQLAELLFTPSEDGDHNLEREGIPRSRIHLVGNVMIDSLMTLLAASERSRALADLGLEARRFGLVTLHRPSTVDDPAMLASVVAALADISRGLRLVFPVHPRTRQRLDTLGATVGARVTLVDPLSYLDFLALQRQATLVITDSGGIQEETTVLGIPCLTLRDNTERPITVTLGTNVVVGRDTARLRLEVERILGGKGKVGQVPPLWDGKAGERIAATIVEWSSADE
jgi:UDP-N-acetylglucosamine 2-epimerase (non-hydrolysing)